jgi:hypothetical protein
MVPISDGLARAVADRASVYLPNLSPDRDSDFDGAGALPATHASKQTFRAILAACKVTFTGRLRARGGCDKLRPLTDAVRGEVRPSQPSTAR